MRLYGSTSSPFVRRVRVVAEEVGESVERVDTATEAGLAALRKITPIGKVPTAIVDGRVLLRLARYRRLARHDPRLARPA